MTLITLLVIFERSYVVANICKVSLLGLNWSRNYGAALFAPPGYLMSKKIRLVRVKTTSKKRNTTKGIGTLIDNKIANKIKATA